MSDCELCGEPMPAGEEMFKYHGLSGPYPKALSAPETPIALERPWMKYLTPKDQERLMEKVLEYLDRDNVFGDYFSEYEVQQIATLLGRTWEE